MSSGNNKASRYAVYEFVAGGECTKSDKVFLFDQEEMKKRYGCHSEPAIIPEFLRQFFPGMTSGAGFSASFLTKDKDPVAEILLTWKTPHWKLVKES